MKVSHCRRRRCKVGYLNLIDYPRRLPSVSIQRLPVAPVGRTTYSPSVPVVPDSTSIAANSIIFFIVSTFCVASGCRPDLRVDRFGLVQIPASVTPPGAVTR